MPDINMVPNMENETNPTETAPASTPVSIPTPLTSTTQGPNLKEKMSLNVDTTRIREVIINFLVPLICLVAALVLGLAVLYPSYKALPAAEQDAKQKKELNELLVAKKDVLKKMMDFKSVVDQDSELVNSVLVSEAKVPELLTQIDQIAEESGLQITKLSYTITNMPTPAGAPDSAASTSSYKMVNVSMGAMCTYDQLMAFMKNLENSARLVNVDSFRYSVGTDEKDTTQLNVSFDLQSPYLYVESKAVTDDALKLNINDPQFIALINKIKDLKFYRISIEDINQDLVNEASATPHTWGTKVNEAQSSITEETTVDETTPSETTTREPTPQPVMP